MQPRNTPAPERYAVTVRWKTASLISTAWAALSMLNRMNSTCRTTSGASARGIAIPNRSARTSAAEMARSNGAGSIMTKPDSAMMHHSVARASLPCPRSPVPGDVIAASVTSIGVPRVEQRYGGHRQDVQVEHHRPVLDVVEVVLDPALDLLRCVGFPAPAVDLRPAGDARLDLVAREVAVDDLAIELVGSLRHRRVGARADQRQVALQHVEQLRQLVQAGLADEAADAGHPRIAP